MKERKEKPMEIQVNGKIIKFGKNCHFVNINDLVPYKKNPKNHNDKDVTLIAKSIERNGFGESLLVCPETNEILSGNGRYLAAKKLGLEEIPVVYAPEGLSEKQKADLVIASNKLVDVSGYNDNLFDLIEDFGLDIEDFGIGADELPDHEERKTGETVDSIKKVKITFNYEDSREVIDTFIREMNTLYPELMTKVEIND